MLHLQMAQNATDYDMLRELTEQEQSVAQELDKLMDRWA